MDSTACETKFCTLRERAYLCKIFINAYKREPVDDAELEKFLKFLNTFHREPVEDELKRFKEHVKGGD